MDRRTFLLGAVGWVVLGRVVRPPTRGAVLSAVNQRRAASGRRALVVDRGIARRAQRHAEHMAAAGYWFHSNLQLPAGAKWAGEVVGIADDIPSMVRAWMHSPDHRPIILHRAASVAGVGVACGDRWYFVLQVAAF